LTRELPGRRRHNARHPDSLRTGQSWESYTRFAETVAYMTSSDSSIDL